MAYRISETAAASPDMADSEFLNLVDDIRQHGQLVPIWKSGDEIIDGRKRLKACEILGIEPKVIDLSPGQDADALSYSLNILRTHYTVGQRAMLAERRATATKAESALRRHRADRNYDIQKTVREAANEAGVERSAVFQARAIRRAAPPEVVAAVEAGRLTLHAAEQMAKGAPTPTRDGFRRSPKRDLTLRVERALDQLDNAVNRLSEWIAEGVASQHPDVATWVRHLGEARAGLSKIINGHRRIA